MLILASQSPRRRELLRRLGHPFEVRTVEIDELADCDDPRQVPLINAERKAAAVSLQYPDTLVLGADTVIIHDNQVIGKPSDIGNALDILMRLAGKTHEVLTGLALLRRNPEFRCVWSEKTCVKFHNFTLETAKAYLEKVNVLDKAGAYGIQEYGEMLVEAVDGSVENVIGLPLNRLNHELIQFV